MFIALPCGLASLKCLITIEADVVIIGGGFSGINTALELAEQGITNVVVLEDFKQRFQPLFADVLFHRFDVVTDTGHHLAAIAPGERIRKYNIDADFVPGYGYLAYNQRQLKTLRQWENSRMMPAPRLAILNSVSSPSLPTCFFTASMS
jgi:gamma-glutamylputrescine oxidase